MIPRQNWLGIVGWQAGEDGDNDRWVSLWHLGDSDYHQRLPLRDEVSDLEFSADDLWVAAASRYDPLVRVWDLTDFSESKRDQRPLRMHLEFKVAGRGVDDLQFLKNRNALLVRDGASRVWNLESRVTLGRSLVMRRSACAS